jgi:hypothetical protein
VVHQRRACEQLRWSKPHRRVRKAKEGRLVHHRGCHCVEGQWHGPVEKGNHVGDWSSDGIMLWLGRRQNRDTIEW